MDNFMDEVLEATESCVQDFVKISREIDERLQQTEDLVSKCLEQLPITASEEVESDIEKEFQDQAALIATINESKIDLEKLKVSLNLLKKEESKLASEHSHLRHKFATFSSKVDELQEKKELINNKKKELLAYQLLTGVDFVYKTRKVTGFVAKETLKPFVMDPSKMSQEEITRNLWKLILD